LTCSIPIAMVKTIVTTGFKALSMVMKDTDK